MPLTNSDPSKPAITPGSDHKNATAYDYWDHVDFIIAEANRRNIYVGLLPSWGAWAPNARATPDPKVVFNAENARAYGEFLGKRYGKNKGIIWILGGDRVIKGPEEIWRAMAAGIAKGTNGRDDFVGLLMTWHPPGGGLIHNWQSPGQS